MPYSQFSPANELSVCWFLHEQKGGVHLLLSNTVYALTECRIAGASQVLSCVRTSSQDTHVLSIDVDKFSRDLLTRMMYEGHSEDIFNVGVEDIETHRPAIVPQLRIETVKPIY